MEFQTILADNFYWSSDTIFLERSSRVIMMDTFNYSIKTSRENNKSHTRSSLRCLKYNLKVQIPFLDFDRMSQRVL